MRHGGAGRGRPPGWSPQPGRAPQPGTFRIDGGLAELVADADRPGGWLLSINGVAQSYVDLADPTHLEFDYVRYIGHVVDLVASAGTAIDVLHLGGGGLTLARYVAATRPGSRQTVVESDAALVSLVRQQLGTPRRAGVRIRVGDARRRLSGLPAESADVVVGDVFDGGTVPTHLTSVEFAGAVRRVLRPGGVYVANLADGPPLRFARAQVATWRTLTAGVSLLAPAGVLRGRRWGNLVLLADLGALPLDELVRRLAGDPFPARLLPPAAAGRFAAGWPPVTDDTALPSPPIPGRSLRLPGVGDG